MAVTPPFTLVVLDWDGTITENSTLDLIASINKASHLPRFESFTQAWGADYKKLADSYVPHHGERRTLTQELAWLDSIRVVERASVERLEDSRIWQGVQGPLMLCSKNITSTTAAVPESNIQDAAERAVTENKIAFRQGFDSLLNDVAQSNGAAAIAVLSVSWSGVWVSRAISARLKQENNPDYYYPQARSAREMRSPNPHEEDLIVYANELDPSGSGRMSRGLPSTVEISSGEETYEERFDYNFERRGPGLWTAGDKALVFEKILAEYQSRLKGRSEDNSSITLPPVRTVYVGDSTTDLACLLKADIGICMRPKESNSTAEELQETLQRLEIPCVDMREAQHHDLISSAFRTAQDLESSVASASKTPKRLWHASEFQTISDVLFSG